MTKKNTIITTMAMMSDDSEDVDDDDCEDCGVVTCRGCAVAPQGAAREDCEDREAATAYKRSLMAVSIARLSAMIDISSVKTSTALAANLGSEVSYDESLGVFVLTKR